MITIKLNQIRLEIKSPEMMRNREVQTVSGEIKVDVDSEFMKYIRRVFGDWPVKEPEPESIAKPVPEPPAAE